MRIAGYDSLTLRASAVAARRDVNMMLVVDRSASLHPNNADAWDDVQEATTFFVSQFDDARDQVGLVTFGTSSQVDVAMAGQFFKPRSPTRSTRRLCRNSASTNAPQGLWLGYGELLAEGGREPAQCDRLLYRWAGNDYVPYCGSSPQEAVIGAYQSGGTFYDLAGFWEPQADGPPVTTPATSPRGVYAYAPTPMQLRQAFQSVANEIFRLVR